MNDRSSTNGPSPAVRQAMGLLQLPIEPARDARTGYVDVLGGVDVIGPTFAQRTMRNRFVSRVYERLWRPAVSRVFLGLRGPLATGERRIVMGMLCVGPGDRVLDVGCGPGTYTRHLACAAQDGLVIGVDASEMMLAAGVRRGPPPNVAYVRADACALPFGDADFDAVGCFGSIHLVEDPMKALDEMARVLAPGGRLALLATFRRSGARRVRSPKGIRVFEADELTDALRERGLVDVKQLVIGRGQFVSARKGGSSYVVHP